MKPLKQPMFTLKVTLLSKKPLEGLSIMEKKHCVLQYKVIQTPKTKTKAKKTNAKNPNKS